MAKVIGYATVLDRLRPQFTDRKALRDAARSLTPKYIDPVTGRAYYSESSIKKELGPWPRCDTCKKKFFFRDSFRSQCAHCGKFSCCWESMYRCSRDCARAIFRKAWNKLKLEKEQELQCRKQNRIQLALLKKMVKSPAALPLPEQELKQAAT